MSGRGRFLGVNVGINANPAYKGTWWGEGEVKIFLNGDGAHPSFAGTGSEDYIGTGWGEGEFFNDHSGCLVADEKHLQWAFYRFQVPDPVFFDSGCRVTLQQIGGGPKATLADAAEGERPPHPGQHRPRGQPRPALPGGRRAQADDPALPDGWMNFYRSDDVSATAYFYLSTPSDDLPPLQPSCPHRGAEIAPRPGPERPAAYSAAERDHRVDLGRRGAGKGRRRRTAAMGRRRTRGPRII